MNTMYNVSIPFLQMRSCRVRDSKFGYALVVETSVQSGEYILGFRVDPEEKLETVCKSIQALHSAYVASPIFGVQFSKEKAEPEPEPEESAAIQEDAEIEDKPMRIDAFAAYFSDGVDSEEQRPIVYSEELGVAIEQLKPGFTVSDLWNIHID
ncbi:Bardet-Biedl syndrome 5-like protein [Aphelenchoides avenae]|nr:Bardet-Biedl syndrome 5-like protein [Aphelenchus avenae]KAH7717226.1 Bardet-Biedl syndrome 5-like protein [Aphelenchus avenae]